MSRVQDRLKSILEAREKLNLEPVFLDTETTGVERRDEIVDICVVDCDGTILIDTLIKPTISIPFGATRIHGITSEMVQNAPTWKEIWPQVGAVLRDRHIGVYNADFDLRMIEQANRKYGIQWRNPSARAFCIMKLYARFYGAWNHKYGSYRWQKLENAGRQCNISIPNSHRAKDDTLLARAVLHYIAKSN